MKKKRGLTLIEIVVVTAIGAGLMGLILTILLQTRGTFQNSESTVAMQENARLIIAKLSQELRNSSPNQISITQNSPASGTDTLVYHLAKDADGNDIPDLTAGDAIDWGNAITIQVNPAEKRLYKNGSEILGNNIKSINFTNHAMDGSLYTNELKIDVEMEITAAGGKVYNITISSTVNMRNL